MTDSIRVFDPGFRITDANGNNVSGAKAKFYDAGTLNTRTVYSDSGLSTSLGSTVTANSAGVLCASGGAGAAVIIYTGTTAYKVIITDPSDVTLFEFDNISGALDTSSFQATTALPRTPVISKSSNYTVVDGDRGKIINVDSTGGDVTITLPSAVTVGDNWRVTIRHVGTANDVIIEAAGGQTINGATSQTLPHQYESITLVSDGANYHIAEDGTIRRPAGVVLPQGYLTPTSGTPAITSDATAAAAVYYTPDVGNLLPIYNGTRFVPYEFSELTLTLVSQHTASSIFDVFGSLDGTTVRIGTGPAWSTITAGSGARGTGAGTTELERIGGLLVNAESITARNGTSTYTVDANKGTYLGTLFIDGTNGQITCHTSDGSARKWAIFNMYNRKNIVLRAYDSTASWNYNSATIRQSRADTNNKITLGFGIDDQYPKFSFTQRIRQAASDGSSRIGFGINSTTVFSSVGGFHELPAGKDGDVVASLIDTRKLGINVYNLVEQSSASGTTTFVGSATTSMIATADFWA